MVVVSYSGKEINAKLVYYGAGLCGKTTNLESIYEAVPDNSRGKMVSMKTQSDRTLFFDLLPLDLGEIMGFKTRFLLYTVPGQVFYNATRKLVLKGADAIVFVADSERGKMDENKESLENLRTNLSEYGLKLDEVPWVLQYNKRDLPDVYTIEELDAELNPGGKVPAFEAVAINGKGVFETFRGISHMLMEKVTRELRRTPMPRPLSRPAPGSAAPPAPSARAPQTSVPAQPAAKDEAPKPEGRKVAAAPESLGQNIMREARETEPAAQEQTPPLDYGRELTLSDGPAAPGPPSPADAPSSPQSIPGFEPGLTSSASSHDDNGPSLSLNVERTAPAAAATKAAKDTGVQEITVPVTIPKGSRQIVLRIVLSQSDS